VANITGKSSNKILYAIITFTLMLNKDRYMRTVQVWWECGTASRKSACRICENGLNATKYTRVGTLIVATIYL